jgi:hypothetical protein
MTQKIKGEVFIALVFQHMLPKGFRRARGYEFLQGNTKKLLTHLDSAETDDTCKN